MDKMNGIIYILEIFLKKKSNYFTFFSMIYLLISFQNNFFVRFEKVNFN